MYTATVLLSITTFVPMSGHVSASPSIRAVIAPPQDTSPPPAPPQPVFSVNGESIVITVPRGYTSVVQLTYQLPDTRYVLLGAAYWGPNGGVGRVLFPAISVSRDLYGSQMTVTDSCTKAFNNLDFSYVILVQEVTTGNIGLIDPDIENNNED
jgi:hypothetical protein